MITLKRSIFGVLILAAFCFASLISTWITNWPSNRVIKQWHQPKDIQYQSFDPYTLSVIEGSINWNDIRLPRHYQLFIGKGDEAPDYGHYIEYSFHPMSENIEKHIGRSNVEWTADGATFVENSGHRLFIPKKMFIGGR